MLSPFHTSHLIFACCAVDMISSVWEMRHREAKKLTQVIPTSIFGAKFAPVSFFQVCPAITHCIHFQMVSFLSNHKALWFKLKLLVLLKIFRV